jgi:hypothetical protein
MLSLAECFGLDIILHVLPIVLTKRESENFLGWCRGKGVPHVCTRKYIIGDRSGHKKKKKKKSNTKSKENKRAGPR